MTTQIVPLDDAQLCERVYDEILAASFPPSELSTRESFLDEWRAGQLEGLVALHNGAPCGAVIGERCGAVMLIAWLAVHGDHRGEGTGAALLAAGAQRWIRMDDIELVLAEIERPDVHEAHERYGDPVRRLRFYAREGAAALDLPYFQPPIADGMPKVHGLLLAVIADRASSPVPRMLSGGEHDAVRGFLTATMGSSVSDDPDVRRVHAALNSARIRVLPLSDYRQIPR